MNDSAASVSQLPIGSPNRSRRQQVSLLESLGSGRLRRFGERQEEPSKEVGDEIDTMRLTILEVSS
jgi:hypothetical protein